MHGAKLFERCLFPAAGMGVASLLLVFAARAEEPVAAKLSEPVFRVSKSDPAVRPAQALAEGRPSEHPLMPAIRLAKAGLAKIDKDVKDYSCTLVKRESVDGKLGEEQYIFCKIRHKPFSVYMLFLGPTAIKNQECIYVKGENKGKQLVEVS